MTDLSKITTTKIDWKYAYRLVQETESVGEAMASSTVACVSPLNHAA